MIEKKSVHNGNTLSSLIYCLEIYYVKICIINLILTFYVAFKHEKSFNYLVTGYYYSLNSRYL